MQNIDLRIKSNKQFLVKNKIGAARNFYFFDFFSIEIFFWSSFSSF